MIFPSIRRSFQKRKYVIVLDIGEILEKGVHESSVCDTGLYIFPNFHILSNSHSKFPTIWTNFFNSHLHLTILFCLFNSLILQYLPHVTYFRQNVPTLPFNSPFVRVRRHILNQHLFLIQPMV